MFCSNLRPYQAVYVMACKYTAIINSFKFFKPLADKLDSVVPVVVCKQKVILELAVY
uniref:Uncharacterized protein n=1 Tax=mine drainage metagenome TaxID=410659 RepID=E6PHB3_9ZZZZ